MARSQKHKRDTTDLEPTAPPARRAKLTSGALQNLQEEIAASESIVASPLSTWQAVPDIIPSAASGTMPPPAASGTMPPPAASRSMPLPAPYGTMPPHASYGSMPPPAPYGTMPPPASYGTMPQPASYGTMPPPPSYWSIPPPVAPRSMPSPAISGSKDKGSSKSSSNSRSRVSATGGSLAETAGSPAGPQYYAKAIDDARIPEWLQVNGIFPYTDSNEPSNMTALRQTLCEERRSLSPKTFDRRAAYRQFSAENNNAANESTVMTGTAGRLLGDPGRYRYGSSVPFDELGMILPRDYSVPPPKPDWYDAAKSSNLHGRLRNDPDLRRSIQHRERTGHILANLGIEWKSGDGNARTVRTQALWNGAHAARAVHDLHNVGRAPPTFDRESHTLQYTVYDGVVRAYSTHAESPTGDRAADYHTSLVASADMLDSPDRFVDGLTLIRNGRDYCARSRDSLINEANARASALPAHPPTYRPSSLTPVTSSTSPRSQTSHRSSGAPMYRDARKPRRLSKAKRARGESEDSEEEEGY